MQGNPAVEAVEPKEITRSELAVEVQVDAPVMLRFSQRIQPGWQVFVNGKEQPLLTLDYLVMGVKLEAGHQVVEFRAPQSRAALYILGLGFVACVSGGVLVSRKS